MQADTVATLHSYHTSNRPNPTKQDVEEVSALFWAAHFVSCAARATAAGLAELAARQLTAALRYAGLIPSDRCAKSVCVF